MVDVLKNFSIYETSRDFRTVCKEFRDAGTDRINERKGRLLFEEGMAFFKGLDHKKQDVARAYELFFTSCDAGCSTAAILLSMMQDTESLVDDDQDDDDDLLKSFLMTEKSSYHWDQCLQGIQFLLEDNEMIQNAVSVLTKAAEQGNTEAMFALHEIQGRQQQAAATNSNSLEEIQKKALFWLTRASDAGHGSARYSLAQYYAMAKDGVELDISKAHHLLTLSAEQNIVNAQYTLGLWYRKGNENGETIIPINDKLFLFWMSKAANQQHPQAQINIGLAHMTKRAPDADQGTGFAWFLSAASNGDGYARMLIARCYENGHGVQMSIERALYWFKKAVEFGVENAVAEVVRLS